MSKRLVYLDYAATTPVDRRVMEKMLPYFSQEFGNPSALYKRGRGNLRAITEARFVISKTFDCAPEEIIFTGSGTESGNLAVLGTARANRVQGNHIVTTKIEHPAVLNSAKQLEKEGFQVTFLEVDESGLVAPEAMLKAITNKTILISIIYANNEIGTIEPIAEIGKALMKYNKVKRVSCKKQRVYFHTDACQAAGALELNVNRLHVDLMTINGSKIYGPKGVGALYKKRDVKIQPLIFGGEQEFHLRAGTENVAGIVGLAQALRLAQESKEQENARLTKLREYFWQGLRKSIPKIILNGHPVQRLPNNLNATILDIEGEAMLLYLDEMGVQAATGSACNSQSLEPSHVLLAIGRPYEFAHGSLRFTLGRSTVKADIDYVLKILPGIVEKLREISPVRLNMAGV